MTAGATDGAAKPTKSHAPPPKQSLDQPTAEKVAAAHPGVSCPSSYSRDECERAVETAAAPSPSVAVSDPADCVKAMSEAECGELFAAEDQARASGTGSVTAQECLAHPELPACAGAVEAMEAEYEAAHPGG
ncbi:MAG TPA: hypothetical protein VIJ21_06630 [Solirubrobacterales bacterium]